MESNQKTCYRIEYVEGSFSDYWILKYKRKIKPHPLLRLLGITKDRIEWWRIPSSFRQTENLDSEFPKVKEFGGSVNSMSKEDLLLFVTEFPCIEDYFERMREDLERFKNDTKTIQIGCDE